jgi:PAS domain S-box-containing protein/diguanylate cyclase (GGDEF)-like protein
MKLPAWPLFNKTDSDFAPDQPEGAESRWSSLLAILCLVMSGVAAYLLQANPTKMAGSQIPPWVTARSAWSLIALLGVQMAYQQMRMTRLRRELRHREALFRVITENAADMIALVSTKGKRIYNSPAYQKVLGYTASELGETSALEQVHPDDRYKLLEASRQARESGAGKQMEYRIRHKNGSWLVFESRASVIRNRRGEVEALVIINRDVTDRKRAEEELVRNALRDPLTGLLNHSGLLDRMRHCQTSAGRNSAYQYAILVLDVDGFKELNRAHGRAFGDTLLVDVSRRLAAILCLEDPSAPLSSVPAVSDVALSGPGGDEFVILFEGVAGAADALRLAELARSSFTDPFIIDTHRLSLTASVGIAMSGAAEQTAEHNLQDAHAAMLRARNLGGARCELYETLAHDRAVNRLQLETDLRDALQRRELEVFYQPIVRLDSGRIVSMEALVRWHHPRKGLVSPFQFLQAAEDMGLMIPIGKWVLEEACRQVYAWQRSFPHSQQLGMTVNISAQQFTNERLVADVRSAVHLSRIQPSDLQLEITESMAMANHAQSAQIFAQLKQLRVSLTIDDFGVGASFLSRLQNFPADALKLDRSFVSGTLGDPRRADLVELIVALAHSLHMRVIAEGIETPAQFNRLRSLGCELGQGYLFCRPLSVTAVERLLDAIGSQPDFLLRKQGLRSLIPQLS